MPLPPTCPDNDKHSYQKDRLTGFCFDAFLYFRAYILCVICRVQPPHVSAFLAEFLLRLCMALVPLMAQQTPVQRALCLPFLCDILTVVPGNLLSQLDCHVSIEICSGTTLLTQTTYFNPRVRRCRGELLNCRHVFLAYVQSRLRSCLLCARAWANKTASGLVAKSATSQLQRYKEQIQTESSCTLQQRQGGRVKPCETDTAFLELQAWGCVPTLVAGPFAVPAVFAAASIHGHIP